MTGLSGTPSHGVRLEVVLDEDASTKDRAVYRGKLYEPEASRDPHRQQRGADQDAPAFVAGQSAAQQGERDQAERHTDAKRRRDARRP